MQTPSQKRLSKMVKLLKAHNIICSLCDASKDAAYIVKGNNKRYIRIPLGLYGVTKLDPADLVSKEIAHEIGHYLACSLEDRKLDDYGLNGKGDVESELEEFKARIYERFILQHFGIGVENRNLRTWQRKIPPILKRELKKNNIKFSVTNWWKNEGEKNIKEFLKPAKKTARPPVIEQTPALPVAV